MTATGRPPRATLVLRALPVAALGGGRGRRLVVRNLRVQRRQWWVVVSGFAEPFFYLLSIGLGLGHLVGRLPGPHGSVPYATYVAPALLASSAMNGGITEATFNVYHKLRFTKIYTAVLATPLGPEDVARGEIGTALLRGSVYGAAFIAVMAALGDLGSPWGLLAFPAVVLIGFAFAAVGMAVTTYLRGWGDFDLLQLVILPLFLFSTTFFPLGTYPRALQLVVECTPLYQGVTLCRALCLGAPGVALIGPALYLAVMGAAGLAVTSRRVGTLLLR